MTVSVPTRPVALQLRTSGKEVLRVSGRRTIGDAVTEQLLNVGNGTTVSVEVGRVARPGTVAANVTVPVDDPETARVICDLGMTTDHVLPLVFVKVAWWVPVSSVHVVAMFVVLASPERTRLTVTSLSGCPLLSTDTLVGVTDEDVSVTDVPVAPVALVVRPPVEPVTVLWCVFASALLRLKW